MKKYSNIIIILLIVFLTFTSCSVVFKGGVGGVVRDEDDNPIEGMRVYVYYDEAARNSDFRTYETNPESVQQSTLIKGSASTDANGNFNINAVIWNSTSPVFGKTADYKQVYFLFYHELYGLKKNTYTTYIYSDSTNSGAVNESFNKEKERATLTINIEDVAYKNTLNETVTAHIEIYTMSDVFIESKKREITGTGNVEITKAIDQEVKVKISLTTENSDWRQCNEDGTIPPLQHERSFSLQSASTTLYMKSSRLTLPSLNGIYRSEDYTEQADKDFGTGNDDQVVLLLCSLESGTPVPFDSPNARVVTNRRITGANTPIIEHGLFSGLGEGIEFTDTTYTGRFATKEVAILIDEDDDGPTTGDKYRIITLSSNETTRNLGQLNKAASDFEPL